MQRYTTSKIQGFTLVEIMIVIAILGLLFSLVGPRIMDKFKDSQKQAAKIQIASFQQALQQYYLSHNMYPHTSQGLDALVKKPTVGKAPENYPEKGHLAKNSIPKDPWANDYRYECEDYQNFTIGSDGPNGKPGDDDDVKGE